MHRYLGILAALALACSPAHGQGLGDSKQPIEINADRLEVVQPEQKAVFSGNVVATQGNVVLKADRMTVLYRNAEQKTGAQGAVSRIEVDGNVQMTTPTESASGRRGAYNVDAKQILLFGDVTLRRDKNVLKGEKLEYNLQTGRSLLNAAEASSPAGTPAQGGRVKGVFIPQGKGQ